jgi:glycine cleavage system H protein
MVEVQIDAQPEVQVDLGERIGWIEGFKAVSDVYSVVRGRFARANPALREDITLVEAAPYHDGWLYSVVGEPDPAAVDANGYVAILDATIEKMLEGRHERSYP